MGDTGKNMSYGNRHMATLWNPFSYKNTEPKYPDGLAQYSIGKKYVNITRISGQEIVVVLYPGALGWCVIYSGQQQDDTKPTQLHAANYHGAGRSSTRYEHQSAWDGKDGDAKFWTITKKKYAAWRPVSVAFKVKSTDGNVGACGKNDGWWEAVRVSDAVDNEHFGLVLNDSDHAEAGQIIPSEQYIKRLTTTNGWSLLPSYATGGANELGRFTFQLNQIRNDNKFVDVGDDIKAWATGIKGEVVADFLQTQHVTSLVYPTMQSNPTLVTQENAVQLYTSPRGHLRKADQSEDLSATNPQHLAEVKGWDSTHSDAFDIVALKLHGTAESEYLISSCCNQEYLCNDTELEEYATSSYGAQKELEEYLAIRARDYRMPNHSYYNQKKKF